MHGEFAAQATPLVPLAAGAVPWRAVAWPELSQLLASGGRGRHHTRSYVEVRLRADPGEIRSMWDRRILDREPLQYLTSSADWRDFVVSVGPGVLIPRPGECCPVAGIDEIDGRL